MKINFSKNKAFTLVEIMVATSIFMIIMLMSLAALITTSDTAKKSQALRSAMDNVNFAMESMTRSLRMGRDYTCVASSSGVSLPASANADCPISSSGGGAIIFSPTGHDATPRDSAYMVTARGDGTNVLQYCTTTSCVDMVSTNVDIQYLKFYVNGSDVADKIQPSAYIVMKGVVVVKGVPKTFAIQTMASQRPGE